MSRQNFFWCKPAKVKVSKSQRETNLSGYWHQTTNIDQAGVLLLESNSFPTRKQKFVIFVFHNIINFWVSQYSLWWKWLNEWASDGQYGQYYVRKVWIWSRTKDSHEWESLSCVCLFVWNSITIHLYLHFNKQSAPPLSSVLFCISPSISYVRNLRQIPHFLFSCFSTDWQTDTHR